MMKYLIICFLIVKVSFAQNINVEKVFTKQNVEIIPLFENLDSLYNGTDSIKVTGQNGMQLCVIFSNDGTNVGVDRILYQDSVYNLLSDEQTMFYGYLKGYFISTKTTSYLVFISTYQGCNGYRCRLRPFTFFALNDNLEVTQVINYDVVYGDVKNILDYNNDGNLELIKVVFDNQTEKESNYTLSSVSLVSVDSGMSVQNEEGENYTLKIRLNTIYTSLSEKNADFEVIESNWYNTKSR